MGKFYALFFLFLLPFSHCFGQTDTEFWFVAPEVAKYTNDLDRPIYLRLSTYAQASTITVSQPANPSFTPITVTLASSSSTSIDLSPYIDMVENKPPDVVNNYGIHIVGTGEFSVYYEVLGGPFCNTCNPEFFSLKGSNALGTGFWIPMQQTYRNASAYTPTPYSAFDIVATEDATVVTITPSKNVVGHTAGTAYTVTLNRGQTYSCTASSQLAADHPSGSRVTSNNPIAITVKDDLMDLAGEDLAGDQLIPDSRIGTEYIVVRSPTGATDIACILATQNNTQVNINGTPVTTLSAGQTYQYNVPAAGVGAVYIQTSAPVYVFQLTTASGEAGGAILPPIICTGSTEISVTRSTAEPFYVFLITLDQHKGSFLFNGSVATIGPAAFQAVPGTAGAWAFAVIDLSSTATVGAANRISNTSGLFHMGLLQGLARGSGYGYFSAFSLPADTDTTLALCPNDSITLTASIPGYHLWSTGDTTPTINVGDTGIYWVRNLLTNCNVTDTFHIIPAPVTTFSLGNDTTVCSGETVRLQPPAGYTYTWQDAGINVFYDVTQAGTYYVTIDSPGFFCPVSDTIVVNYFPEQLINLGPDSVLCSPHPVQLSVPGTFHNVLWQNSIPGNSYTVTPEDTVTVSALDSNGCAARDTIVIRIYSTITTTSTDTVCPGDTITLYSNYPNSPSVWNTGAVGDSLRITQPGIYWAATEVGAYCPFVDSFTVVPTSGITFSLGNDTTVCFGETVHLQAPAGYTYTWQDASGASFYYVTQAGTYYVHIQSAGLCSAADTIEIDYFPHQPVSLPDTSVCSGQPVQLSVPLTYHNVLWQNATPGNTYTVTTTPQTVTLSALDNNNCTVRDTLTVNSATAINITTAVDHCSGDTIALYTNFPGNPHIWSNSSTADSILVTQPGTYWAQTLLGGCTYMDTFNVALLPDISFSLGTDIRQCAGTAYTIQAPAGYTYTWQDNSHNANYVVPVSGTYYVRLDSAGFCSASDTIEVVYVIHADIDLGPDTTLCPNETLVLNAGSSYHNVVWQNTSSGNSYTVTAYPSLVIVTALDSNNCPVADTLQATRLEPVFLADTAVCLGVTHTLDAGAGYVSYLWQDNSTQQQLAVSVPGTYSVITESINGCTDTATAYVDFIDKAFADAGDNDTMCMGLNRQLHAGGGVTYRWEPAATLSDADIADPVASPAITTNYTLVATDAGGCRSLDTVIVVVMDGPLVPADAGPDNEVCPGTSIQLQATGEAGTYQWLPADGLSDPNIADPLASPDTSMVYLLTVTGMYGCVDTSSVMIKVPDEAGSIKLPLAFSPDNNQHNDLFRIIHPEDYDLEVFSIFDRWGNKVFTTTDPEQGWDGIYNDEPAPLDVYTYYLKATTKTCPRSVFLKGNVTLVR